MYNKEKNLIPIWYKYKKYQINRLIKHKFLYSVNRNNKVVAFTQSLEEAEKLINSNFKIK